MAFSDIAGKVKYPRGLSTRYRTQDQLLKFLDGTLYDDAKLTAFDQERTGYNSGEYIPLRQRRPSVVSNFARQFVEQTIGLLWADEQFPVLRVYSAENPDEQKTDIEKTIGHLIEACSLDEVLARVTYLGSIGSVAVVVRGLDGEGKRDGQPWIEVWRGYQCVPVFDERNPTILSELSTIYPTTGETLRIGGRTDIPDDELKDTFWLRIDLNAKLEQRYKPLRQDLFERLGEKDTDGHVIQWVKDEAYAHKFGVCPAVWGKAPNASHLELDGPCVFAAAVDTIVELDYQLSQIGRAYKYTMDPMMAIRRGVIDATSYSPSGSAPNRTQTDEAGNLIKSAANVVDVESGGDASLLELKGHGLTAALEFVQRLREYALESIGGMKSDSETQKGAQSGKALELLYQALVIVIKRLRLTWGNHVLVPLVELILRGITTGELQIPGITSVDPESIIMRLKWPQWMTPTGADFLATVQGWQILAGASAQAPTPILDEDTVTRLAATNLGFNDSEAMVKQARAQRDANDQKEQEQMQADQQHQLALAKTKTGPAGKGAK